jgi:hypothetical protein
MAYQDTLTGENSRKRNVDGVFRVNVPALATAVAGAVIVGVAPFDGVVESVKFYPNALMTGQDTNTRLHRVYNRKDDNTGVAVMATLQYNAGVNAPAKQAKTLTLSGTPANLAVEEGDVIEFDSSVVLTGLADAGGLLEVKLARSGGS